MLLKALTWACLIYQYCGAGGNLNLEGSACASEDVDAAAEYGACVLLVLQKNRCSLKEQTEELLGAVKAGLGVPPSALPAAGSLKMLLLLCPKTSSSLISR